MLEIKNKLAVIYCRVSTEEQAKEGISVESQSLVCERKAIEEGYTILKFIKDEGKSAGTLKRPGMQELIQLVMDRKMEIIYTVHSDRLSRDTIDHLNLMSLFKKYGIKIKFTNQANFEKDDASSKLIGTVMASVNQFQRDITSEKVKSTMAEKAKAGYFPGKAPLGYKNISDPNSTERFARKTIIIDKEKESFVREAFRLYGTGEYNVIDVTEILCEKGLRTSSGKKVFHSKIYEMMKNKFYIGEIHWGEVHLENAKHPPLITRELFDRVQKILGSNNKHSCRKRKFTWLLNGFMVCYKHGCRYTAEWHMNKKIAYYHCTKGGCGKFSEQNKLEQMVADKFKQLEFSKDFIDSVINKVKVLFYERRESHDGRRQALINQRTPFEAKLRNAEDKLLSNTISDEDFKRMRTKINSELEIIDRQMMSIQKEKEIDVDLAKEVMGLTNNIYETYQKASPQLKRLLLGFFWEKFEVADGLIINSVSSVLFTELIKAEKAYIKTENHQKPIVSNELIKSHNWCA